MITCSVCKKVSHALQADLFDNRCICIGCLTQERAKMMLNTLPDPEDWEYQKLTKWEQEFLASVRLRCMGPLGVTEKQYEVLERIWEKLNK